MGTILSNLFFAVRYNLTGIIFFLAAIFFARKGKTFWHWYAIGAALQGYSIFGTVLGFIKEPETWLTPEKILAVITFFVLTILCFVFLKHFEKRHP